MCVLKSEKNKKNWSFDFGLQGSESNEKMPFKKR